MLLKFLEGHNDVTHICGMGAISAHIK